MPISGFEKIQRSCQTNETWNFLNKASQDPQKPEKKSGQSVENRTISGNPYYLVIFEIVLYRGSYY